MHSRKSSTTKPIVLRTERLVLRMADPADDADCEAILNMNRDPSASQGGQSKLGIDTIEAVRRKCQRQGPTAEFCTLAPPPYGQSFLIYLRSRGDEAEDEVIGEIGLSFRREMPYPDLGYGVKGGYMGQGYATEAGLRVLDFWRDEVGVKNIWIGTLPGNARSQALAHRLGVVEAGTFDIMFGQSPAFESVKGAVAFVWPGVHWPDGMTIYPTIPKDEIAATPRIHAESNKA